MRWPVLQGLCSRHTLVLWAVRRALKGRRGLQKVPFVAALQEQSRWRNLAPPQAVFLYFFSVFQFHSFFSFSLCLLLLIICGFIMRNIRGLEFIRRRSLSWAHDLAHAELSSLLVHLWGNRVLEKCGIILSRFSEPTGAAYVVAPRPFMRSSSFDMHIWCWPPPHWRY